jgi:hypothetical protein
MDTFDEWVKTVQYPCIQEWGEKVVALGASWDSFRRDDKKQITADLVNGGIPILAARDIVDIATAEVQKSAAPMAIFWDLENMPIPSAFSGRDMTSVLKSILAPHGDLIQFRGYASIGLNLIPQEKRSDLQLSGCHLVDCPHHGRKEVADKMIIVDAMHFAYQHPDGATLCFITGDVDYAYLLAVLQQRPQWRTIVISRGTMQSMLHVNCDMKIRWETDILKTIYSSRQELPEVDDLDLDDDDNQDFVASDDEANQPKHQKPFAPLTADEFWKDDVELLRNVMIQEGRRVGTRTPRKSQVGNTLRQTNPARFPTRESLKGFFAQAIEKGIVVESGDGPFKTLAVADTPNQNAGWLTVSACSPLAPHEMPAKALDLASKDLPFILFIRKHHCPSGYYPPNKAYIQSTDDWLMLLYPSYGHVLQSVGDHPWLQKATLVDWRNGSARKTCSFCGAQWSEQVCATDGSQPGRSFCSAECMEWSDVDEPTKTKAVERVVDTLEFMAANDDIFVNQSLTAKIISVRYPNDCLDKKYARLWVKEAIQAGAVVEFKRLESKNKMICLEQNRSEAFGDFPPAGAPTHAEERFIRNLLWKEGSLGGLDRRYVAKALASTFEGMNTPLRRNQVLMNAQAYGNIYLCKGPSLHIIGLTKEQAEAALSIVMDKTGQDQSLPILPNTLDLPADDDNGNDGVETTMGAHSSSLKPGLRNEQAVPALSLETAKRSSPEPSLVRDDFINDTLVLPAEGYDDTNCVMSANTRSDSDASDDSDGKSLDSGSSTSSGSDIDLSALLSKTKTSTRSSSPSTTTASVLIKEATKDAEPPVSSTISLPAREQNDPMQAARTPKIFPRVDENGNNASRSLHVSGFGDGTTKQDIHRLFKPFSRNVEVVPKCFGSHLFMFVNTASNDNAIEARMHMYGRLFNGGRLKINFAK